MLRHKWLLFIILLFGLIIRLYSVNYGLPYIVGPDEKRQVLDALSMGARHSLVPLEYTYPALHKYLLLFLFGAYFSIGFIVRVFSNLPDFISKFLIDPGSIFLLARLLSVSFGIAVTIPVYLLGKDLFSRYVAVVASTFAMFMFNLVIHSQLAISDIILTLWSIWAFYYIIRCMLRSYTKDFILTGIFIGLAISTKYQGIYLLIPFIAMLILNIKGFILKEKIVQKLFLTVLVMLVFASVGNLSFILNPQESLQRFIELKDEKMGISSIQPFPHSFFSVVGWFVKEMIRQEKSLGFILIIGIIYSIYKHSKIDLIFLSYLFICLFSVKNFGFRFLHLVVYSFAIMCVFGARFIGRFSHSLIIPLIIIIPSLNHAIQADIKRTNPDTRLQAKEWIEENIPHGSNIALDWYDFCVPLMSEVPWLFQNGKIRQYYEDYISKDIKQRYRDYAVTQGVYSIRQIRYETKEPIWPEDMPQEVIECADKIPIIKRLYNWFNFYNIEDLQEMGISYIVISSYSYNHFLLDDDPNKITGLYNSLILEDTLSSNRHAKTYNKNNKYGLLFFLAKRARDFYLPLLNLENKGVKLIKEIYPDSKHFGPVIKIYRLEG